MWLRLGCAWVSLCGNPTRCLTAGKLASAVRVYDSGWAWVSRTLRVNLLRVLVRRGDSATEFGLLRR